MKIRRNEDGAAVVYDVPEFVAGLFQDRCDQAHRLGIYYFAGFPIAALLFPEPRWAGAWYSFAALAVWGGGSWFLLNKWPPRVLRRAEDQAIQHFKAFGRWPNRLS